MAIGLEADGKRYAIYILYIRWNMTDIFKDSLEWSAVDIELTEQLIASADNRSFAQNTSTHGTGSVSAQPTPPQKRITRSSRRLSALAVSKAGSGDCNTSVDTSKADRGTKEDATEDPQQRPVDSITADGAARGCGQIAEARQLVRVPDLEDIGLRQDRRRFRPHGFSVTDFTASQWCQQQFALALSAHLPEACSPGSVSIAPTPLAHQRHTAPSGPDDIHVTVLTNRRPNCSHAVQEGLREQCEAHAGGHRDGDHGKRPGAAPSAGGGGEGGGGRGAGHSGGRLGAAPAELHPVPTPAHEARTDQRGLPLRAAAGDTDLQLPVTTVLHTSSPGCSLQC